MWSLTVFCLSLVVVVAFGAPKTKVQEDVGNLRQPAVRQSARLVQCAIQAFGTGLNDKGIRLEIERPGFFCGSDTIDKIVRTADFNGDEAEILVSLPADDFRMCFHTMNMWVTLPYPCSTFNRLINGAEWGFGSSPIGSCRVLEQKCGSVTSAAAVPYVDMWCRRPSDYLGGRAEEMRLKWSFPQSGDTC